MSRTTSLDAPNIPVVSIIRTALTIVPDQTVAFGWGFYTLYDAHEPKKQRLLSAFRHTYVRERRIPLIGLLLAFIIPAVADTSYLSAKRKLDQIESDRLRPGTTVELSPGELLAYAQHELPPGVRNPRLQLVSPGVASGTALVDFVKLRRSQGAEPGWLMSTLLNGERPVSVTARIRSSNGQATVDVDKVEISGMTIEGNTLDFLIQNVLVPLYPNAAVGKPFDLGHRIESLTVRPRGVTVLIGH